MNNEVVSLHNAWVIVLALGDFSKFLKYQTINLIIKYHFQCNTFTWRNDLNTSSTTVMYCVCFTYKPDGTNSCCSNTRSEKVHKPSSDICLFCVTVHDTSSCLWMSYRGGNDHQGNSNVSYFISNIWDVPPNAACQLTASATCTEARKIPHLKRNGDMNGDVMMRDSGWEQSVHSHRYYTAAVEENVSNTSVNT